MKNTLAVIGSGAYKYYLKPLPNVAKTAVLKAVLAHVIATTLALLLAGLAKLIERTEKAK